MPCGTVVRSERGQWGFVQSDEQQSIFWHVSDVKNSCILRELDRVSFDIVPNPAGRSSNLRAVKVELLIPPQRKSTQSAASISNREAENESR